MRLHAVTRRDDVFVYGKSWDISALEGGTVEFWGEWMQTVAGYDACIRRLRSGD